MKYQPSTPISDQINIPSPQLKRTKVLQKTLFKKWICKNHPSSPWGQDQFGNWYPQCYYGHSTGTACELLKEVNGESSNIKCECGEYG